MPLTPEQEQELLILERELGSDDYQAEIQILEESLINEGFSDRASQSLDERGQQALKMSQDIKSKSGHLPMSADMLDYAVRVGGKAGFGMIGDVTGEIASSAMQGVKNIDEFLGGYGGKATEAVVGAVADIPTPAGRLGDVTKQALSSTSDAYSKFSESNPEAAQRLEGVANMTLIGVPFAKWGDDLVDNTYKTFKNIPKKDVARMNSDEVAAIGGSLFEKADRVGGQVTEGFWSDYLRNSERALTRRSDLGKGIEQASGVRDTLEKVQQAMNDVTGSPQSLTAIKEADEILGKLAYNSLDNFGNMDLQGKQFKTMQSVLREMIDEAPADTFIGGKEAFNTVKEARRYWAASRRMQEVEKIIDSAKNRPQPSTILKNGFARLERDKKNFKSYTPEEQFAIKKAAKTGSMEGFVRLQGSGLVPVIAGGAGMAASGGVAGGLASIPAYAYQQGSKAIAENMAGKKAQKVLDVVQAGATGQAPSLPSMYSGAALAAGAKTVAPIGAAYAPQKETMADRARRIYGEN